MKLIPLLILLALMSIVAFGQNAREPKMLTQTVKIDAFLGRGSCCDLGARIDYAMLFRDKNPDSKIYIVFYEGQKVALRRWNKKLNKNENLLVNPIRREFLYLKAGILKQVKFQKLDPNNFVFVDGGFRPERVVEIWIAPEGSQPPELTPTIDKKSITFSRNPDDRVPLVCF